VFLYFVRQFISGVKGKVEILSAYFPTKYYLTLTLRAVPLQEWRRGSMRRTSSSNP